MPEEFSGGAEVLVYRETAADNYTIVGNHILRNKLPVKLSAVARMVLLHLLSLPDQGWKLDRDKLAQHFTEGVGQIRKALAELRAQGYLAQTRQRRDNGTFTWLWMVSERPRFHPQGVDEVCAGHTTGQNPATGPTEAFPQVTPLVNNHPMVNQPMVSRPTDTFSYKELPPLPLPPADPDPPVVTTGVGGEDPPDLVERTAAEIVDALPDHGWGIGRKTRRELIPLVTDALTGAYGGAPWTKTQLMRKLTENREGVKFPGATLRTRLEDLPEPPRRRRGQSVPWCGQCSDTIGRMVLDEDDKPVGKCHCHPGYRPAAAEREHTG